MQFSSAITDTGDAALAAAKVAERISGRLDPAAVDLLVVHGAGYEPDDLEHAFEQLDLTFPAAASVGCSAWGTIGSNREHYEGPSLAVLAGSLPGVAVQTFALDPERLQGDDDWLDELSIEPEDAPLCLVLADPFTCPMHVFLEGLNDQRPGVPVLGGLASSARESGQNRLLLDGEIRDRGLVGVLLSGAIRVDTVVSQGCRPIGRPYVVTQGEGNLIAALGGRANAEVLQELVADLSEDDVELIRTGGLFMGSAIDARKREFRRGDFLIQNVLGTDASSGAIAVAGQVRRGATVQFHVRDAYTADEDLRKLLAPHDIADGGPPPAAALLFSCNGRGTAMWEEPGHDAGVLHTSCGDIPVTGFFCAGEIGPVGGRNFVHGFTASIALLRPPA